MISLLFKVVAGYGGAQAVARLTNELNRQGSSWDYVISDPLVQLTKQNVMLSFGKKQNQENRSG
jgi:hypothetical protein